MWVFCSTALYILKRPIQNMILTELILANTFSFVEELGVFTKKAEAMTEQLSKIHHIGALKSPQFVR